MAESDYDLIARFQSGDRSALEELHRQYDGQVRGYLCHYAGRAAADDLTQQTWAKVCQHLQNFDPTKNKGGFWPWLSQIARRLCIDRWRRSGREISASSGSDDQPDPLTSAVSQEPAPEDYATAQEHVLHLRDCIDRLPERLRPVCVLVYLEGRQVREVAELLDRPMGTVAGQTDEVRRRLRTCLELKGIVL